MENKENTVYKMERIWNREYREQRKHIVNQTLNQKIEQKRKSSQEIYLSEETIESNFYYERTFTK